MTINANALQFSKLCEIHDNHLHIHENPRKCIMFFENQLNYMLPIAAIYGNVMNLNNTRPQIDGNQIHFRTASTESMDFVMDSFNNLNRNLSQDHLSRTDKFP